MIKTFLRPDCLSRLLVSIHRYYPRTPTIVVDDSGNGDAATICRSYPWIKLIEIEKDSGISRGRNVGLSEITTKYFVLFDDDCICWVLTDIKWMIQKLEQVGADILCGPMCDVRRGVICQGALAFAEYDTGHIVVHSDIPIGEEGWVKGSNNFFVARTRIREMVQWPDDLKTQEHAPFFWLFHQEGGKVWMSGRSSVAHLATNNNEYEWFRNRVYTQADSELTEAWETFRKQQRFTWLRSDLEALIGPQYSGMRTLWTRHLMPSSETQRLLLEHTANYTSRCPAIGLQ